MDLLEEIVNIICERFGTEPDEITSQTSLIDDLLLDNIDCLQLIKGVEEKYDLEIPDIDMEKMNTIGDIVRYIEEKTKIS